MRFTTAFPLFAENVRLRAGSGIVKSIYVGHRLRRDMVVCQTLRLWAASTL